MVNSMVERATSEMLIGPDWAMNIDICDICNRDPTQAKDVVKGIKRRIRSRNSKVQLLALTLLETIVKNCGDIIHMQVAEKDVLHEMVKIVRKKPDFHVKEKILILIDTWQEVFGGARARYPQYFAAYQELLRMGAVFPQRSETSAAPVLTPPQTQPLTSSSYPEDLSNPEHGKQVAEASAESEYPTLSLTELQNARGIMDVLAEMLSALAPENKAGLRQEVIIDLVEQCRTYKQRVVHLVNSTSDESLLCQGLALNDELQRLLAKHEALVSGTSCAAMMDKSQPEPVRALVPIVDAPLIDTGDDSKLPHQGSTSTSGGRAQLLVPISLATNGPSKISANANPKMDLLSGDDFSSPRAESCLAIVPVGEPQPSSPPVSQQNALALVDAFSQSNNPPPPPPVGQTYYSSQPQNFHSLQAPQIYHSNPNGSIPNMATNIPAWNGQQQQSPSPVYGGESSESSLPPPPWEAEPAADSSSSSQWRGGNQYSQPPPMQYNNNYFNPPQVPGGGGQMAFMYPPQQQQQQMYNNNHQMPVYGYGGGYGYGTYEQQQQQQNAQQRMSGLSVMDDSTSAATLLRNNNNLSSYVPSGKPSNPQDKLFGDLVDISKFKPNPASRAGSL